MKRLDISDQTAISMPMKNLIAIVSAVAVGVWAYFGVIERLNKLETQSVLLEKDMSAEDERLHNEVTKNTDFRIRYPRGELGQSSQDIEQFMLIEHLAGELEKLSKDIEEGKAPYDQQQALTLQFYETRINKLEKSIDELKDRIVSNHYEAVGNGKH